MSRKQQPIRILIVDDEKIIRYGINAALQCESALKVVGEASNGKEAINQVDRLSPDIVLMDIHMPVMNGVLATEKICQKYPDIKVLILTTSTENHHLHDAIQKGASGYLLKNTPPGDFIHIIQSAHKGYMQFDPFMGQKLQRQTLSIGTEGQHDWGTLTPREQEVLELVAEGANNREIGQKLCIAEKTVKNHVSSIMNRLGLRNRTQLAIWVHRLDAET